MIIEPAHGVAPLLTAIKGAKTSVEIAIFRFDRTDVENALKAAAARGIKVTALIAFTNRGGEQRLRKREQSFLDAGIIVARTSDDLTRSRQVHPDRPACPVRAVLQFHAPRYRSQPRLRHREHRGPTG
jgi:phosphatidylserine/phosphatidylglycerophosphate/cardiolipin synthase-like enzyme